MFQSPSHANYFTCGWETFRKKNPEIRYIATCQVHTEATQWERCWDMYVRSDVFRIHNVYKIPVWSTEVTGGFKESTSVLCIRSRHRFCVLHVHVNAYHIGSVHILMLTTSVLCTSFCDDYVLEVTGPKWPLSRLMFLHKLFVWVLQCRWGRMWCWCRMLWASARIYNVSLRSCWPSLRLWVRLLTKYIHHASLFTIVISSGDCSWPMQCHRAGFFEWLIYTRVPIVFGVQ